MNNVNQDLGLLNLVGNVLMFMSVGFLIPLATRSGFRRALAACVAISVAVEFLPDSPWREASTWTMSC